MMEDLNPIQDDYEGKSAGRMLAEVGRLLLLLLGKLLKVLGRLVLRLLRLLLKLVCKGLLALIDGTRVAIERLQEFWNDNNTQEKLRKLRAWIVLAGQKLWEWTVVAARATWKGLLWTARNSAEGLVWLLRKTVQGIIHLGPTLKAAGRALKRAAQAVGRWLRRLWRGLRKWHAERRRAYRHFRQNKGFKGLLVDVGNWLRGQIRDYVEEEPLPQSLPAEVVDETEDDDDDPFRALDERAGNSKIHTMGKRLYDAMKRIVED